MKDVRVLVMLLLTVVFLVVPVGQLRGSLLIVGESGDDVGSAVNVDASFDLAFDADIFNSTTIPHVSISSDNNATTDVDWYSFSGIAGGTVDLDIDYADGQGVSFDPILSLFNFGSTLLAYDDDSPVDPGSTVPYDSFIGTYTLPYTGLYYAAVSNWNNFPTVGGATSALIRPDGQSGGTAVSFGTADFASGDGIYSTGDYVLHISVNPVPEPSSLAILTALGLFAAAIRRQRNAR